MIRLHRWKSVLTVALMLGMVLAVAGCSSGVKSAQVSKAKAAGKFDLVVKTYKSGQFLLNGAIISPLDLSSHFAYLRDQHELPKTVLLERSKDEKIHKKHLRYIASMAYTYGFTVYYNDDGELRRIVPTATSKMDLEDVPPPSKQKGHPHVDNYDATH